MKDKMHHGHQAREVGWLFDPVQRSWFQRLTFRAWALRRIKSHYGSWCGLEYVIRQSLVHKITRGALALPCNFPSPFNATAKSRHFGSLPVGNGTGLGREPLSHLKPPALPWRGANPSACEQALFSREIYFILSRIVRVNFTAQLLQPRSTENLFLQIGQWCSSDETIE